MSQGTASLLLTKISDASKAFDERRFAIYGNASIAYQERSGNPSSVVARIKQDVRAILPKFIDHTQAVGGSFNDWFSDYEPDPQRPRSEPSFPMWTTQGLLNYLGLPSNMFDSTPRLGGDILSDSGRGIWALSSVLSQLSAFPITTFRQVNEELLYSLDLRESYLFEDIDKGYCGGSNGECDIDLETIVSGLPVSQKGCGLPDTVPTNSQYGGAARWSVVFSASYSMLDQQNGDNYTWYGPIWDRTHTIKENLSIQYERQSVTSISLESNELKEGLKGIIKPYAKYSYQPVSNEVHTVPEPAGCSDTFWMDVDEDGNDAGYFKSGVKYDLFVTNTYIVAGWDPELNQKYRSVSSGIKAPDATSMVIHVSVPGDPFRNLSPYVISEHDYSCDALSDPHYFGLGYHGVTGYIKTSEECQSVIPKRNLTYKIGPVLMEAQFDYCP